MWTLQNQTIRCKDITWCLDIKSHAEKSVSMKQLLMIANAGILARSINTARRKMLVKVIEIPPDSITYERQTLWNFND